MGIKFGEVDANQIIENEFRINVLEGILEKVINTIPNAISPSDIDQIKQASIEKLQEKYPNSGIHKK